MTTFFVDPQSGHNPTTGEFIPSSWGDDVRNGLMFLVSPPMVKAHRTTVQAIADSTWTVVQLNAADSWDTDAFHDISTNNARLTIPSGFGAKYAVHGFVEWESNNAGVRGLRLLKNGATVTNEDLRDVDSTVAHRVSFYDEIELLQSEYVEMQVFQSTGSSLNLSTARFGLRFISL